MRIWVDDGDTVIRAIKELGLVRDESSSDLIVDTYRTVTGSKVTFHLDTGTPFKDQDIKVWRCSDE